MTALAPRQFRINRWLWATIILIGVVDGIWLHRAGMTIDMTRAPVILWMFAICIGVGAFYRYLRRDDMLYLFCQLGAQLIAGTAVLGTLSYLSSRLNFPLVDEQLIALDRLLLFDWRSWLAELNHWPTLAQVLTWAYISAKPQIIAILFFLLLYRQVAQMQRFLIAFFFSGLVTIVLAALWPAVGGYVHYDLDAAQFTNLRPAAARLHEQILLALRDHSMARLDFPLEGLVTFPSFHSTIALLFIYASLPVRWLFALLLPLNLLVLLSTPADGGHYLVDVGAGVLIAVLAVMFAQRLLPVETSKEKAG